MNIIYRINNTCRFPGAMPVICALLLTIISCATAPSATAIPPFRQGVLTANQQTAAAFADINSFLRRQQIEHAMKQTALTEDLFFEALGSEDLVKWDHAFGFIDSYAAKLERLLDPNQRAGVEEEISALGQKIEAVNKDQLPTGFSAAFTKLGGFLVQMKAEHNAFAAIRKADPAIQNVFNAMMEAIGVDPGSGIRGTVNASWRQILAHIDVTEFRRAGSEGAKRAAVTHYVETLDQRDAQDRLLNSLRLSLATLAKAHQELAQGREVSAAALIAIIQDEYKAFLDELDAIRRHNEAISTSGGTT